MKNLPRIVFIGIGLSLAVLCHAAKDAGKAEPADVEKAYAPIEKTLGDKEAKPGKRLFEQLSISSVKFINDYPREGQTLKLIGRLLNYGVSTLKSSSAETRLEWYQRVQMEVAAKLLDSATSEEAKTALLALDAAMFEGIFRNRRNNDVFRTWRERINELTERPNSDRFVRDREQGFVEVLYPIKRDATEAHVRKLAESGGRFTKEWAQDELQLMEVRKKPFEVNCTALDGKLVDFQQLRGKYVYLVFWSADAKVLQDQRNALAEAEREISAKKFAVITVLCDRNIDAAKAAEIVAQKNMKWPVLFDGEGESGVYARSLNVSAKNLPMGFLFDQQGMLFKTNVQMKNAVSEVRKLLESDRPAK